MCRSVEDAAICLGAMTGIDPLDPKTLESEDNYLTDYTEFLKTDGLKGKRIGLIKNSGGYSDRVDTLIVRATRDTEAAGALIIEVEAPPRREYADAEFQVLLYEFKDGLNKYFKGRGEDISIKVASLEGHEVNAQPEYEDCQKVARKKQIPVKTILDMAKEEYARREESGFKEN